MAENVYLFVPNLIGYARVLLAFASFYYMPTSPYIAGFLYLLSGLLDAFDGHAARALNQASKYGAVLDMLTDRCATTCLLMVLALFYPKWMLAFQFIVALDITSHWAQMYSSMMKGKTSHKSTEETSNPILKLYYTSRVVLFIMCAGNEIFFAMLYMLHFSSGPVLNLVAVKVGLWKVLAIISLPICVTKNIISIVQMIGAFETIAESDKEDRSKSK
eukprot:Seg1566.11 transcript_id=Seg1566.11/GoldUCD/mRNA.D3Y31 product="CDP-diacylglycerol-inositol 3-phosphatidyltransferase" protein_id=Seg1566.11/GoldUCD/D3Y31